MKMIKAAYNFVPVAEDIPYYQPAWRSQITQDIPFSDGVSGEIILSLVANTAIFVKGDDGRFVNINKEMFIPGTSIKGCIRSVLEILSFGHMNEERVDDEIFPFRDISDRDGYMRKMAKVLCGWLIKDNNQYRILDCGEPGYIHHNDLAAFSSFEKNRFKNAMDAISKYQSCGGSYLSGRFQFKEKNFNRKFYERIEKGGNDGIIVFTGFIEEKKSEFIFFSPARENRKNIHDDVLKTFKELYPEFGKLPRHATNGGIPVFYTEKNNVIKTLGLCYLHKYYAQHSIYDAIPDGLRGKGMDLADAIFGSARHSLKGRVQFGNAKMLKGELLERDKIEAVLNSPKASFYPTYLKGGTWDSAHNVIIAGRKRYPIKPKYDVSPFIPTAKDGGINNDIISKLFPVKENAEFECKVRFHNLRPVELGALLSAITFHGQKNECKHSLGQAKALGYGSVSIKVKNFKTDNQIDSIQTCLQRFEDEMKRYIADWKNHPALKELFEMAKGFSGDKCIDIFTSMLLQTDKKVKALPVKNTLEYKSFKFPGKTPDQFREARNAFSRGERFPSFTERMGIGDSTARKDTGMIVSRKATPIIPKGLLAKVVHCDKGLTTVKLIEGKDNAIKTLKKEIDKKVKLKAGDTVRVRLSNNKNELIYMNKL